MLFQLSLAKSQDRFLCNKSLHDICEEVVAPNNQLLKDILSQVTNWGSIWENIQQNLQDAYTAAEAKRKALLCTGTPDVWMAVYERITIGMSAELQDFKAKFANRKVLNAEINKKINELKILIAEDQNTTIKAEEFCVNKLKQRRDLANMIAEQQSGIKSVRQSIFQEILTKLNEERGKIESVSFSFFKRRLNNYELLKQQLLKAKSNEEKILIKQTDQQTQYLESMKKNHSHKFNLLDDIYQLTLEKTGLQRAEPVNEVDQLFQRELLNTRQKSVCCDPESDLFFRKALERIQKKQILCAKIMDNNKFQEYLGMQIGQLKYHADREARFIYHCRKCFPLSSELPEDQTEQLENITESYVQLTQKLSEIENRLLFCEYIPWLRQQDSHIWQIDRKTESRMIHILKELLEDCRKQGDYYSAHQLLVILNHAEYALKQPHKQRTDRTVSVAKSFIDAVKGESLWRYPQMWEAALLEHYYGYISGKVADLKYSRNRSESLQSIVEEVPINKKTHSMNFSKDQGSDKGSKFMSIFKAVTKTPSKLNGHGEATEIYRNLLHFCIACMTVLDLPKEIINEFADGSVKACRASLKQQNDIVDKLKTDINQFAREHSKTVVQFLKNEDIDKKCIALSQSVTSEENNNRKENNNHKDNNKRKKM